MEHNSKSSRATITPVSTPKKENDWYLPENVIDSDAIVNKVLYNELNESSFFNDLMPEYLCKKKTSTSKENSYSPPFTAGIRESGWRKLNQALKENVSFIDIFGNKTEQLKQRLSFSTAKIGDGQMKNDSQFFPSDVGKEMLLKDEEDNEKESMMNVSSCSSWSICTRKTVIDDSLPDVNGLPRQHCYTVGEYMRKMSEPLGDISGEVFSEKVNFGCDASTPMPDKTAFPDFPEIHNIQNKHKMPEHVPIHGYISNFNIHSQNECTSPIKTGSLFPMFLYSVKKETVNFDYKKMIGPSTFIDLISNTLRQMITYVWDISNSDTVYVQKEDTTILKIDTTGTTIEIAHGENSVTEKWIVQPEELTLDINSKGSRISLMNCSDTDLKGEIGLRILVSRYIKKQFKHDAEDAVIITCGKREKAIHVKICKKNFKALSLKDRTFMCF